MDPASTEQPRVDSERLSIPFDSIREPYLVLSPEDDLVLANGAAMESLDTSRTLTISELEKILSTDIRSSAEHVVASGETVELDICGPSDLEGSSRRFRMRMSCCFDVPLNSTRSCIVRLKDSTDEFALEDRLTLVETELSIVSQVSAQLGSIMDSEEIHKIILIAVTAREGLGFNRAFLFRCDDQCEYLLGSHALGPIDADEAGRIWNSIPDDGSDLRTIISRYRRTVRFENVTLDGRVKGVKIPVTDNRSTVRDAITRGEAMHVTDRTKLDYISECTGGLLGQSEVAVAPLAAQKSVLGLIIADNDITGSPISNDEVDQLQMFASQCAMALERAKLYERLENNLKELALTNRKLERTQREIVRIERLSLMGELSYRIAHELRNPLTIIGGFASLLSRAKGMESTEKERAQVIQKECRRIEKQLDELLDYSRSYSQEEIEVDLKEIVIGALDMVYPRLSSSVFMLDTDQHSETCSIWAHKDQLLHGIYNIFLILDELSGDSLKWRISIYCRDNRAIIDLLPDESTMGRDESIDVVRNFVRGRVGKSGLKLSLASETIRYNGGEVGFSIDKSSPRVYLSFDRG